jgi:tetratricopeptide (TPR) repeat protein
MGDQAAAKQQWEQSAAQEDTEGWPETRFYQAMSLEQLGKRAEAKQIFEDLVQQGEERIQRDSSPDVFAKFGEQKTRRTRAASAHYLLGLAYKGLGRAAESADQMSKAVELNQSHVWARRYLEK